MHAYEMLNKKTIPALRLSLIDLVNGKYSKYELSHFFVLSERVAISLAVEKLLGNRQGQRTDRGRQSVVKVKGRTDDFIANLLNFGNRQTYQHAKKVCQAGSHELIEVVDQGQLAVSAAAILTQLSVSEQKEILLRPRKEIIACVNRLRRQCPSFYNTIPSMEKTS